MYLKAIELQGFKSFPDKTVLTFGTGITAIVGPNGSGKSNISDAIRWVLGEQSSRALRGGKMEDVIFGGTQKRSQVGFAEVSLIIDNTQEILPIEHNDVMITRRYYRSGESEYYINRHSVRLKDIHELFMDTGLGREGYSIIGQGRIDEILSIKSEDRREIFEEAAGISRYRHRKEESERKLSATEENLIRINDKIAELMLQVEPLKEQSEKAHKYLLIRDELRVTEVGVWLDSLDKIKAGAIKLEADYTAAAAQVEKENELLDELYKKTELLSEEMRRKDTEAEELRETVARIEMKISECESAHAVLNTNHSHNMENIERITREISEKEDRTGSLTEQAEERKSRMDALSAELDAAKKALSDLIGEAQKTSESTVTIAEKIEAARVNEVLKTSVLSELKAELSSLSASAQELLDRDGAIHKELLGAKDELLNFEEDEKSLNDKLGETREQFSSSANVIDGYMLRLKNRQKRADETKERAAALKLEYQTVHSRIHMLSEMEKEYEGYSKAVKTVMHETERGNLKNIHGPVSMLIKAFPEYTAAIETAMGAALQNIVVDSEEDGKAAINLLKSRDGGRATFLPISAIKGTELSEPGIEKEPGFIGIASRLVEFDSKYTQIIRNILGRTVVITDINAAVAMARKYSYRFRIVTTDGQIMNPGGAMTGGSVGRDTGILSRKNELSRLSEKAKSIEKETDAAQKEFLSAERELNAVKYELEVAQGEQRVLQDEIIKLETQENNMKAWKEGIHNKIETYKNEISAVKERLSGNAERTKSVGETIKLHETEINDIKEELNRLTEGQAELLKKNSGLADRIGEAKALCASLEAESIACERSLSEVMSLISEISGDHEQSRRIIEEYKGKNREIEAQSESKKEELKALKEQCENARRSIQEINERKLNIEAERTLKDRESKDKNRELIDISREVSRLEQKKAASDFEEQQILEKLWEHYALSHSAAKAMNVRLESVSKANRRIAELKKDIAELGNVNIGAIDEYARVSERYEFLKGQHDDVKKAKDDLLNIIEDITGEMKTIFAEQFKIINKNFGETFLEIFGGGKAELELLDKNDILNCGIEIRVQPPGKSLKTITLLSGGEKAFVAIALYFSILKVRPTPFCVLDEIEAALDDINVNRFAHYLRRLSDSTQFIVITHRRGTMEEADVLYGVTMQEQGVSRMLSINLNDAEKKLNIKLK